MSVFYVYNIETPVYKSYFLNNLFPKCKSKCDLFYVYTGYIFAQTTVVYRCIYDKYKFHQK